MQEENDLEKQLEQARKKNLAEIQKTKVLRAEFDKLKTNYSSQVEDLRKKLGAENSRREAS